MLIGHAWAPEVPHWVAPRGHVACDRLRRPDGVHWHAREIAAVIAFLASPQAAYVTGASWPVDGGMLQMGPQAGSHITTDEWRTA